MKTTKTIVVVFCALAAQISFALTETVDGVEWTYHLENGDAILGDYKEVIRCSGAIGTNYYNAISLDTEESIKIPDMLDGHKVVEVGRFAFANCTKITEVVFGNYITNIARSAFSECNSLTNVCFNEGLEVIQVLAFYKTSNLQIITFPKTLKRIDRSAFASTCEYDSYKDKYYYSRGSLHIAFFEGNCPDVTSDFIGRTTYGQEYVAPGILFGGIQWKDEGNSSYYHTMVLFVCGRNGWGEPGDTWEGGTLSHGTSRVVQQTDGQIASRKQIVNPNQKVKLDCLNGGLTFISWNGQKYGAGIYSYFWNSYACFSYKIYYTLNGATPTTNDIPYSSEIIITKPTTIRATAEVSYNSGYVTIPSIYRLNIPPSVQPYDTLHNNSLLKYTTVETCSYAFGQTVTPAISTSQQPFNCSGNVVTLSCETEDAEIRYTLDGCEPTEESALYTGPFTIDDTTMVRAKAFKEDWFDSETTTATFMREWYTVETPAIVPGDTTFANASQTVTISCETDGATIYYTTDGSDPLENGLAYKGPFKVYKSCEIRAVAVKDDWKDSAEATSVLTRGEQLSEAANFYGRKMETGADAPWVVDTEISHDGVSSVRSGGDGSYLQMSVSGAGTLSFWWRAMCEDPGYEYYDYGCIKMGDDTVGRIAGEDTGWEYFSTKVASMAKHIFRWEYHKDDEGTFLPDCIWVD